MDPQDYEPADIDPNFSPRSQLLSPDTVKSVLQRPPSPSKQERRFSELPSRLDALGPREERAERAVNHDRRTATASLDFRTLRHLLRETSDKLDAVTRRANKAEATARESRARTFALELQYQTAREASVKASEELKLYKAELARAQQEVMRAQLEINSLAAARDRAEEDAAKSRDTARKASERLKILQAREEGLREGIELGRREGYIEGQTRTISYIGGQARAMASSVDDARITGQDNATSALHTAMRQLDREGRRQNGTSNSRRTSVNSQDELAPQPGPSRAPVAILTPIQEALQEISPSQQASVPLQMPNPHPSQPFAGMPYPASDSFAPQVASGIPSFSLTEPLAVPLSAPRAAPLGSPAPNLNYFDGRNSPGNFGLNAGSSFQATVIPPTPIPLSPAMQPGTEFNVPGPDPASAGMFQPQPQFPPGGFVDPAMRSASPLLGGPPNRVASPLSIFEPNSSGIRAPSPIVAGRSASPLFMQRGLSMPSPGTTAIRNVVEDIITPQETARRRKGKGKRRQDSIGSVPLTITPASPDESISSSEDDSVSRRTSRSSRRAGPSAAHLLSPDQRHIPRPPSRRSSPAHRSTSQSSSPKVEIFDMATAGPVRVSTSLVGEELLEQEQRDLERDRLRRQTASRPHFDLPSMTPGRSRSPLSQNLPPQTPFGIHGDEMTMYGPPGTNRSHASNLPYVPAPGGGVYPGPVSPMPRMSFPPSSGNSTITPVIPGVNFPSSGYTPAPLDGAPSYPNPIAPINGGRPPSATSQLIGPRSPGRDAFPVMSPPSLPSLSRTGSPSHFAHTPYIHPDNPDPLPQPGQTPFSHSRSPIPSRPISRMSINGGMARYDVAPGDHDMYPPPLTPAHAPSPAMSRHSMRSHVTSATQNGNGAAAWNL